jgi:hypothetical protein
MKIASKNVLPSIIGTATRYDKDDIKYVKVYKQKRIFVMNASGKQVEYVPTLINGSIQNVRRSKIV